MAYSNPYYPTGYDDYNNQRLLNKGGGYRPSQQMLNTFNGYGQQPQQPEQLGGQQEQSPTMGSKIKGNIGNGVAIAGAGLDTFNEAKNAPDGLKIDTNAGLTGAAKGAAAGSAAGPWGTLVGAVVGTVAGQVGTFAKVDKNLKNVDSNPNLTSFDSNGTASYQGNSALNSINQLATIKQSAYNIDNKADLTGTRWLGAALFGARRKLRNKIADLQKGIRAGQSNFNKSDINSVAQQNQIQEYNNRLSGQGRMNNLNAIPKNYQQMF